MSNSLARLALLPALLAVALAQPAAAEDAHHPPADGAKPPAAQPAPPGTGQPGMGPGGMMGNMMQMMHQMMSGMQDRGSMHRMRMMGMGMMGQMQDRGPAVERVEGHISFLKAELKIAPAQEKAWGDYAEVLRANAKQLNALAAAHAKAPAAASPVDRIAQQEHMLAARLEIVRRTKPALAALYAALADEQKKTFGELTAAGGRMGMH
jgi:hypothetical protein